MKPFTLNAIAAAALALSSASFAATPAQDHPAVARALAHLSGQASIAAKTGSADGFEASDLIVDADGTEHVRFQRSYKGLPVVGGDVVVHSHGNGALSGTSQTLASQINLGTTPKQSASVASRYALSQFAHKDGAVAGSQLIVYARGDKPVLAWDIAVHGVQKDGTPSQAHMIVDAHSQKVLDRWDDIHTKADVGSGVTLYSGTVPMNDLVNKAGTTYKLKSKPHGNHYTVDMKNGTSTETLYKDSNNVWGTGVKTSSETAAADAHFGAGVAFDYYKNVHGRNGIADDGKGARSRVHYSTAYDNAFWSDQCFCMTYGDGSFFNPLVSLDVAGHEMSHGVTSRTAKLIYSNESGGLNEGTSDIMGSMIEYYAANANDPGDYLIGEEISKTQGKALRYMYSPNIDGGSADCWYSGVGSLDVPYSAGVANHFYYLLAEGTAPAGGPASPTCKAGDTKKATGTGSLTGIGRAKAEKIWFRALTVYMTASETFAKARTDTIKAADDLFGAGSAESQAVAAAWTAVNRP
jgi:Zn-dependent metalloprotease